MAFFAATPLPDLLAPALDYLHHTLPSPIYSFVLRVLSHVFTLFTAVATLYQAIASKEPSQLDMLTILPPLVSLLAAYFALYSIYRTASWAVRTAFWFVKWGLMISVLVAGISWMTGTNKNANGAGIMRSVGGIVLDVINGQGHSPGNPRASSHFKSNPSTRSRPRAWDSFEKHSGWRAQPSEGEPSQPQDVVHEVVGMVDKVLQDKTWWGIAKDIANNLEQARQAAEEGRESRQHQQSR